MDAALGLINIFVLVAWMISLAQWTGRGMPFPKWVHVFAACMFVAGLLASLYLASSNSGLLSLEVFVALTLGLPGVAYCGWVWLFGPEFSADAEAERRRRRHKRRRYR